MTIQQNYLSLNELHLQGTTGGQMISIARFHEKQAADFATREEYKGTKFAENIIQDHIHTAGVIRGIAYRLDPSLAEAAKHRKERYSK